MGNQPMVLIARLDDARVLYAVERESHGLYVLCQLGSWVNIQELRAAAVAWRQEVRTADSQDNVIQEASAPATLPDVKFSKKKRLAIEAIQSLVKRPTTNLLADPLPIPPEPNLPDLSPPNIQQCNSQPIVDEVISPPTASEIFENVRTQYLETLYLSKVSFTTLQYIIVTNYFRLPWHTLQRDLSHELELLFIWTSIPLSN